MPRYAYAQEQTPGKVADSISIIEAELDRIAALVNYNIMDYLPPRSVQTQIQPQHPSRFGPFVQNYMAHEASYDVQSRA